MPFANMFGHDTMKNFTYCIQTMQTDFMGPFLAPSNYTNAVVAENIRTTNNNNRNTMGMFAYIRSAVMNNFSGLYNVFGSLGVYNSIRKLDLPIYLHLQSSGQKVFTDVSHRYSISWPIVCKLATMMGVDTIQTGMIGGYSNDDPNEILACLRILREGNTVPALSCGFHPGLVDWVTSEVGVDYLAGFITEKSLSVDNLFVFLIIFTKLRVPKKAQSQALIVGILIALILRFIFIAVGAAAIAAFSWVFYIFGAFLIYTAISLVKEHFSDADDHDAPGGKFIDFINISS